MDCNNCPISCALWVLGVSTDELLGSNANRGADNGALSLKLTHRLHRIEALPPARKKLVLQTLDTLLKGASSWETTPSAKAGQGALLKGTVRPFLQRWP